MPGQAPSQTGLTGRRPCGTELHRLLRLTERPKITIKKGLKGTAIQHKQSKLLLARWLVIFFASQYERQRVSLSHSKSE